MPTIQFESLNKQSLLESGDQDFLSVMNTIEEYNVNILEIVKIDEVTAMRLDLFVQAYYGSLENLEDFFLFNDIINPFEEPIDRILFLPEMSSLVATKKVVNLNSIATSIRKFSNSYTSSGTKMDKKNSVRSIGFKRLSNGNLVF